jgi:hypothetical protein
MFDFSNDSVLIVIVYVFNAVLYKGREENKKEEHPQAFDKRVRSFQDS